MNDKAISSTLFKKRTHSLMGIWLTIYLMNHLLVNSQAAYFFGEDGKGFIKAVNSIQALPYLPIVEFLILGLPIFVHMILGLKYARDAKYNSFGNTGVTPYLPNYTRNRAYTWQRITSYLLVIGIIAHVVQMRFIDHPSHATVQDKEYYMVLVNLDEGLYTLADRLDVKLYTQDKIKIEREKFKKLPVDKAAGFFYSFYESMKGLFTSPVDESLSQEKIQELLEQQRKKGEENFIQTLENYPVGNGQAIAVSKDFGTAELLVLRETFKVPIMIALYTLFVLAACFHAFNGLWTALISWGLIISEKSQRIFLKLTYFLMLLFSFLGLSAIYATYWINLKN